MQTFDRSAELYDAVYSARGKPYRQEAARLRALLGERGIGPGSSLLDVACGTGEHLRFLAPQYEVTGLDASAAMLRVAREKLPGVTFHQGDMSRFSLDVSFDAITCLFASVGYLPDEGAVGAAMRAMAAHLRPGGLLVLEPALAPDQVAPAVTSRMRFDAVVDSRRVSVTRTDSAVREPSVLRIRFDYEVTPGNGNGPTRTFSEHHPILLLTRERYLRAFREAGLRVGYLEPGLGSTGLYVATTTSPPTNPQPDLR